MKTIYIILAIVTAFTLYKSIANADIPKLYDFNNECGYGWHSTGIIHVRKASISIDCVNDSGDVKTVIGSRL